MSVGFIRLSKVTGKFSCHVLMYGGAFHHTLYAAGMIFRLRYITSNRHVVCASNMSFHPLAVFFFSPT